MEDYNFEENIDCAAEELVYTIKESVKCLTKELKISIKEIIEDFSKSTQITYVYCKTLLKKAKQSMVVQYKGFIEFYKYR